MQKWHYTSNGPQEKASQLSNEALMFYANSFRFFYFFDYELINSTLLFRIQCCICYIAIVSYENLFTLRMFVVLSQL